MPACVGHWLESVQALPRMLQVPELGQVAAVAHAALLLLHLPGGQVVTNVHAGSPLFSVIFPVMIGALVWGGLALRECRVRALLSLQA